MKTTTYKYTVQAQCPCVPENRDRYEFELVMESGKMIEVTELTKWFDANAKEKEVFQEALTERCATTFGCKVKSIGWHHGVQVICEA